MKGQAFSFSQMLMMFVILACIIIVLALFFGGFFDTHTMVEGSDVERHAITMANVLLSSRNLAYSDGSKNLRGIFDKKKLDKNLLKEESSLDILGLRNSARDLGISYPNSIAFVRISDLETNDVWYVSLVGKSTVEGSSMTDYFECLWNNMKIEPQMLFRIPNLSPWKIWDLRKCYMVYASSSGVSTQGFPVAIRVSDLEVHVGAMVVELTEK
jgi:hypothetical protein